MTSAGTHHLLRFARGGRRYRAWETSPRFIPLPHPPDDERSGQTRRVLANRPHSVSSCEMQELAHTPALRGSMLRWAQASVVEGHKLNTRHARRSPAISDPHMNK